MFLLDEYFWLEALLLVLCLCTYLKVKSHYKFFERRGAPYVKPIFLVGSDPDFLRGKTFLGGSFQKMHDSLSGARIGGFFMGLTPSWLVRDPEYVMTILASQFTCFPDRGIVVNEELDPLEAHIFLLGGSRWRFLRNTFSPVFTSGKLKYMYQQMDSCTDTLVECFHKVADERDIDLKETIARYSTDVIASIAFGLKPDCQTNPESEFRKMGLRYFSMNFKKTCKAILRLAFPTVFNALKIPSVEQCITDYFVRIINEVLSFRRRTGTTRNDFIQLALQIQEKGSVTLDPDDREEMEYTTALDSAPENFELTDKLLIAQSFVFYLGGFETTATTLNLCLYLMANHQDVQDKLKAEVQSVKKKHGSFTYDSLKDLHYMDMVVAETLRLYPAVPWIVRKCLKPFTFYDGTTIGKGEMVCISVMAIHRDEHNYPDPESFKPERFENTPAKGTYLPFGDGPRMCIGKRFALIEVKLALSKLIDSFTIEKSPLDTGIKGYAPTFTLHPMDPVMVQVRKKDT